MLKTIQLSLLLIFIFSFLAFGQQLRTPRPSPDATVTQIIGVTEVKIDYSSPAVKGRKIWGETLFRSARSGEPVQMKLLQLLSVIL